MICFSIKHDSNLIGSVHVLLRCSGWSFEPILNTGTLRTYETSVSGSLTITQVIMNFIRE